MKIYNTLTHTKEKFSTNKKDAVSMYVCGVTVYDECHLGHARCYVCFDVIRRYLEYKGYKVTYVQNFTDVDDKIIERAIKIKNEQNYSDLKIAIADLTEKNINAYFQVMDALGIKRADVYPKATEHIKEMIELIQLLIDKELAYEADGDVYFQVHKFKDYGKLSGENLEKLQVGKRVELNPSKRSPIDFALWKSAKPEEPAWDSPWGKGRPGWHIECSAMSAKYLGQPFDIHGGGCDLIFPHHENEIAQSEGGYNKPFVRYWIHNAFLTLNKEKMSKSLGNFFLLKDVFQKYDPEVLRFFLVGAHYRSPMDFSHENLDKAHEQMKRGYMMLKNIQLNFMQEEFSEKRCSSYEQYEDIAKIKQKFEAGMDDDFNTPIAIACLFDLVNLANQLLLQKITTTELEKLAHIKSLFKQLSEVLCVFQYPYKIISLNNKVKTEKEEKIQEFLAKRIQARKDKDWALADEFRDKILALGKDIEIEDTPQGSYVIFGG